MELPEQGAFRGAGVCHRSIVLFLPGHATICESVFSLVQLDGQALPRRLAMLSVAFADQEGDNRQK
jgi:hypothetical protein